MTFIRDINYSNVTFVIITLFLTTYYDISTIFDLFVLFFWMDITT